MMDLIICYEFQLILNFTILTVFGVLLGIRLFWHIRTGSRSSLAHGINYLDFAAWLLNILIILISIYGIVQLFTRSPVVVRTSIPQKGVLSSYTQPITIEFNVPVNLKLLIKNISDNHPGQWIAKPYTGLIPFGRIITFKPLATLPAERKTLIYLSNISGVFQKTYGSEYMLEFFPPRPPQVVKTQPSDQSRNVSSDSEIRFFITGDTTGYDWDAYMGPGIYTHVAPQEDYILITPVSALIQGHEYVVQLFRTEVTRDLISGSISQSGKRESVAQISFSTSRPPFINSFAPQGAGTRVDSHIIIEFSEPMQPQSVVTRFKITPSPEYSVSWSDDNRRLEIVPEHLDQDMEYAVSLSRGIVTAAGGVLEKDAGFVFRTLGPARVVQVMPASGSRQVSPMEKLRLTFDQEMDRESTVNSFEISPPVSGQTSWDGQTLIFSPAPAFNSDQTYRFTINPGARTAAGIATDTELSWEFKTRPDRFSLDVPLFSQNEQFTCNIASLRMLLAYRGVDVSESDIREITGTNGSRGSGNPHLGFTQNYGTYWEPIEKAAHAYRTTKLYQNPSLDMLLLEVRNRNPVMVWGQNGWSDPHEVSWTATDGTFIYAINGMHSYIVKGYVGDSDNPTQILVNDPWRGDTELTTKEFLRRFTYFRTALVVY